jgi:chemotaxis response regulator CheB
LPRDFPGTIEVAQHVDERFSDELANWLAGTSKLPVTLAVVGDVVLPGHIYISEGGRHLVFSTPRMLDYRSTPELNYQPSVDVLFDSVRKHATREVLGVLLTGMGRDGAQGLKRLRDAGHRTIAQDEASSAIYGMPRAAAMIGAAAEILPLAKISSRIAAWTQAQKTEI